jgi:hypothetical protein
MSFATQTFSVQTEQLQFVCPETEKVTALRRQIKKANLVFINVVWSVRGLIGYNGPGPCAGQIQVPPIAIMSRGQP